jgi:hypothetical protein
VDAVVTSARVSLGARVALVSIGIALAVSGCGTNAGDGLPPRVSAPANLEPDGSVPWVDEPAGLREFEFKPVARPPLEGAPPCRADQLDGTLERWTRKGSSDGAGTPPVRDGPAGLFGLIEVRNASSSPCAFAGLAGVRLFIAGRPARVRARSAASDEALRRVVPMRPGDRASLRVDWSPPYCGARGSQRLEVSLPQDGGTLTVPVVRAATPVCSRVETHPELASVLSTSLFDVPPVTPPASPLDPLRASVELPPEAAAPGGPLRFAVRLRNPTDEPIALDPCPGYMISRFALSTGPEPGLNDTRLYRLNCRPVETVPAGEAIRFRMQTAIPARGPGSDGMQLTWSLLAPGLSNAGPGVGPNRVTVDVPVR